MGETTVDTAPRSVVAPDATFVDAVLTLETPLEQIAVLEPDLIFSVTVRQEDIYEELSAIAPTRLQRHHARDIPAASGGGARVWGRGSTHLKWRVPPVD